MRTFVMTIFIVLALMSLLAQAFGDNKSVSEGIYSYRGFGGNFILEIREHGTVMLGDFGTIAYICKSNSKYYCVDSNIFHFAVPKKLTASEKTWSQNKYTYNLVMPAAKLRIFGKLISIAVISSTRVTPAGSKITTFYYYSPTNGLLAFEDRRERKPGDNSILPNADFPSLMFITESKGFAANK